MNSDYETRFGLIRHGQTVWNRERRIQGQMDSPLSADGRRMARMWGEQLAARSWNRILLSDLGRALETGQLMNETLQLTYCQDPRLREQDWGTWTGRTLADLFSLQSQEVREQEARGWDFRPPGGESRTEVLARAQKALICAQRMWPGEDILVISHEGVIKSLLYALCKREFLPAEPKLINGYQLHLLAVDGNSLRLEEVNALKLWKP